MVVPADIVFTFASWAINTALLLSPGVVALADAAIWVVAVTLSSMVEAVAPNGSKKLMPVTPAGVNEAACMALT